MADIESQSGHDSMRQAEGGGAVSVNESQEDQGQHEEFCVMSTKNDTTINLTATSASDTISVDNTNDELISTRAPI